MSSGDNNALPGVNDGANVEAPTGLDQEALGGLIDFSYGQVRKFKQGSDNGRVRIEISNFQAYRRIKKCLK